MKKYIIIGFLTLIAVSLWNCEKDDLCPRTIPTTPRVVIEFYDIDEPTVLKDVTNLLIIAPNLADSLDNFTAKSKITIPLKTNETSTTLRFILNGFDNDTMNDFEDVITFNYTKEDIYISRACGFRTVFKLNDTDPVITIVDDWIKNIEVIQPSIENENETHVKIYF